MNILINNNDITNDTNKDKNKEDKNDTKKKTLLKLTQKQTIYDFIDLAGLRKFLIDCPNMLLMFEILINHIHEYMNLKRLSTNLLMKSSPL